MLTAPKLASPTPPISFETERFRARNITEQDATSRWSAWMKSAHVREGINFPDKPQTRGDMVAYIRSFDQQSKLIMGAFNKQTSRLVALGTAHIRWPHSDFLLNFLIGEETDLNAGILEELSPPFYDHFFEVIGLRTMTANALPTNKAIRFYLRNLGARRIHTLHKSVRRHTDGETIDLLVYELTRDAWRAKKAQRSLAA